MQQSYRKHSRRINISLIKTILSFIFVSLSLYASALPQLTPNSFVSVVTCTPSTGYEGGFGHSSIRVQDDSLRIDVAFNFGSYNAEQSFFIYKVFLGTLLSALEGEHFKKFAQYYKDEKRGVKEYYLNLTLQQKQKLWEYLNGILITGDRFYKFKVPSNNCTTLIRDVLFEQFNWDKTYFQAKASGMTYRDVEHKDPLQDCWQHLLFNLTIGPRSDLPISLYQAAFSPDELIILLKEIKQGGEPLIFAEQELFPAEAFKEKPNKTLTILCFCILLLAAIVISYIQKYKGRTFVWFDRCILLLSGIIGCFLFSLVLFSEITLLDANYSIMWALPTNIVLIFLLKNKSKFTTWLIRLSCCSIILFPIVAFIGHQCIPVEAYLFAATLLIRLSFYLRAEKKTKRK